MRPHELVLQARTDAAGVQGHAPDLRVARREVLGEEDVGEFRVAVADPGVVVGHGALDVSEGEAALGGEQVAAGAEVDDADVGVGFFGGGAAQGGEKLGGQEGVADVVGAELDFVAVFGGAGGHGHDAGVVHEDVEAGGGGGKGVGGLLDGGEGGEVEFEEGDIGVGDLFLDGGDCGFSFGGGAGGEVDAGVMLG